MDDESSCSPCPLILFTIRCCCDPAVVVVVVVVVLALWPGLLVISVELFDEFDKIDPAKLFVEL